MRRDGKREDEGQGGPVSWLAESTLVEARYIRGQLEPILLTCSLQMRVRDRVQRALDALERIVALCEEERKP